MAMDATSIATSGNVAVVGYQASRLASTNEPEDNAVAGGNPAAGRGDSEQGSGTAKERGQPHMTPIFRFDSDAQRMVMLSRDPQSGTVLFQIPTEEALRQYEQNLKRQKAEASSGGASKGDGDKQSAQSAQNAQSAQSAATRLGASAVPPGAGDAADAAANTDQARQGVPGYTARGRAVGSATASGAGAAAASSVRFSVVV